MVEQEPLNAPMRKRIETALTIFFGDGAVSSTLISTIAKNTCHHPSKSWGAVICTVLIVWWDVSFRKILVLVKYVERRWFGNDVCVN